MTIFQNHYTDTMGESKGYSYHKRKSRAEEEAVYARRRGQEVETKRLKFSATCNGMIEALTRCGAHPNNG